MTRVALTSGFVLHRRPYRETSLLLEVYARDHGRIGLLARGARGPRSRRAALLQPFVPLQLGWAGRGELPVLARIEPDGPQLLSPLDDRAVIALYLNELLLRLSAREDPHPALYDAYRAALEELSGQAAAPDLALRRFELALLEALGYGLELNFDAASGAPVASETAYRYVYEQGPVPQGPGIGGTPVSGATLLALASGVLKTAAQRREARALLGGAIEHYLGGRPLRTRELLRDLRRVRGGRFPGERRL